MVSLTPRHPIVRAGNTDIEKNGIIQIKYQCIHRLFSFASPFRSFFYFFHRRSQRKVLTRRSLAFNPRWINNQSSVQGCTIPATLQNRFTTFGLFWFCDWVVTQAWHWSRARGHHFSRKCIARSWTSSREHKTKTDTHTVTDVQLREGRERESWRCNLWVFFNSMIVTWDRDKTSGHLL